MYELTSFVCFVEESFYMQHMHVTQPVSMLVTVLVCSVLLVYSSAQEFYVLPSSPPYPECPLGQTCQTLEDFLSMEDDISSFRDAVTLMFLDGVHELSPTRFFTLNNIPSILLTSTNSSYSNVPTVLIRNMVLNLRNSGSVQIHNIHFMESEMIFTQVDWLLVTNTVYNEGLLLVHSNNVGGMKISHSTFFNCLVGLEMYFGSNSFGGLGIPDGLQHREVVINNTKFLGNEKEVLLFIRSIDSVNLFIDQTHFQMINFNVQVGSRNNVDNNFSGINAEITNCIFENRFNGLNFSSDAGLSNAFILIENTLFVNNDIGLQLLQPGFNTIMSVKIENSTFSNNTLHSAVTARSFQHRFSLKNVKIVDNKNNQRSTFRRVFGINGPITVCVEDCLFDNNSGLSILGLLSTEIYFRGSVIFSNNIEYFGGALAMTDSKMYLENGTALKFFNNSALDIGGGILIDENSVITTYGFSIPYPPCTYQLNFDIFRNENGTMNSIPVSMIFENNSASIAGDDIFGVALQSDCAITRYRDMFSFERLNEIFEFRTPSVSTVSSIPRRVCFCEHGIPLCDSSDIVRTVSITAGEKFYISAVVVGNDFGATGAGSVFALDTEGFNPTFSFSGEQNVQQFQTKGCDYLEYSVLPKNRNSTKVSFLLSTSRSLASSQQLFFANRRDELFDSVNKSLSEYIESGIIRQNLLLAPVFVNVTILPCPKGFEFNSLNGCNCKSELSNFVASCTVVNRAASFLREGRNWIGSMEVNGTQTILGYSFCPFEYCLPEETSIKIDDFDTQCNFNRSDVLCGRCQDGLSLAIGSSSCVPCDNNNGIALLIFFILAGLALVLFIKFFDMTVTQGYVNGLIFYANVVWIYQDTFFVGISNLHTEVHLMNYFYFLRLFIAWLNLDFGIEVCFLKGLDAYTKTWFQFSFPLYIFIISGTIVIACKYSLKVTKLFGNNALSVLVTLFQISSTKLLRSTLLALRPAILTQIEPEVRNKWVWLLDGNIVYFGLAHSFLAIVAIVLLFGWLMISTVLLFPNYSLKLVNYKFPKQALKLTNILEAYNAPLKHKHRYWVGLTLFARLVLVVSVVAFSNIFPQILIALVIVLPAFLVSLVNRVYKQTSVTFLEYCSLMNLIVLGVAFSVTNAADVEIRVKCIIVSVTVSFALFIVISVIHIYLLLAKRFIMMERLKKVDFKNMVKGLKSDNSTKEDIEEMIDPMQAFDAQFVSHSSFSDYRPRDWNAKPVGNTCRWATSLCADIRWLARH